MENVGRIKHILRTVTLCHKPSLKSLAQPAGEEGRIPCCSQQGKVGCFCFPVTPVTNTCPSTQMPLAMQAKCKTKLLRTASQNIPCEGEKMPFPPNYDFLWECLHFSAISFKQKLMSSQYLVEIGAFRVFFGKL